MAYSKIARTESLQSVDGDGATDEENHLDATIDCGRSSVDGGSCVASKTAAELPAAAELPTVVLDMNSAADEADPDVKVASDTAADKI